MDYSTYWSYYGADLVTQFGQHYIVVIAASLLSAIAGVSLGLAVYRTPQASQIALRACGIILTIPSLALYVLLLSVMGLGWPPVLLALTLYALLPIVQNTIVGLVGVNSGVVEAASGIGMSRVQRLVKIELPLAWPVILAGVRTSALLLVSTATIGAIVRGPGLGNSIYEGLNRIGTPTALYAVGSGIVGIVVVGLTLNFAFLIITKLTIPGGISD